MTSNPFFHLCSLVIWSALTVGVAACGGGDEERNDNSTGAGVSSGGEHFVQGYEFEGNAWFQAGVASAGAGKLFHNFLAGHNETNPVERLVLRENYAWATLPDERDGNAL
jgi:hypothetical protein